MLLFSHYCDLQDSKVKQCVAIFDEDISEDSASTVTLDFPSQSLGSYSNYSIDLSFMLNGIELRRLNLTAQSDSRS